LVDIIILSLFSPISY